MSSYYLNTGRVPNWRALCIHVFGAPCRFAIPTGPVHKRAEITEEGYYVGVQHPMAIVIRKSDMKLVSVSTKKLHVYESAYCAPLVENIDVKPAHFEHAVVNTESDCEKPPQPARSVKSLREHEIQIPHKISHRIRPPTTLDASANAQYAGPGEGEYVPEHLSYSSRDQLSNDIRALQEKAKSTISEPSIREKIINGLRKAHEANNGEHDSGVLRRGKEEALQRAGRRASSRMEVGSSNVISGKRTRSGESPPVSKKAKSDLPNKMDANGRKKVKSNGLKIGVGDLVSASPNIFDGTVPGSFSSANPERQYGVVTKVWSKKKKRERIVQVKWAGGESCRIGASDLRLEKAKLTGVNILTVLIAEGRKPLYDSQDKSDWPKDFFHALVRDDWRKWVAAVKKEIDSWNDFNAFTTIPIEEKTPGASIVPLGELYTRKRDGSYKFRQYLLGNLLKEGKDFIETFSSTVSWDGIRWCASVACATNKLIYGLDAVTGFLQAKEQFDLYAYLPSHGEYSNLSYEELALLRADLLELVSDRGEQGLKTFARRHKKASRDNPSHCYKLNQCIYGSRSANHEFEMLFQQAHVACGLSLSEVEPSIYVKIVVDNNDLVVDWLIVYVWTDDARYFGTENLRLKYEKQVGEHLKVKFLGQCLDFVGTEFHQDLSRGLCELKAPKYWEQAGERFNYLFPNGFKKRNTPLSVADGLVLQEKVTEDEWMQARELPFRELCGVISYPAACSKVEMRLAVSMCGRYRDKWGIRQFSVLKKTFEYGMHTRHTGIIYSKGLDPHGINVLSCYADSAHSIPRSQGCHIVLMNGGCISCESKRHTVTGASTCHDELIQFGKATNKVVGFRNLSSEMGLAQQKPTVVYQDNESAICIELNRGSLSSRSKHIDRTILQSRQKIEDAEVVPEFISTNRMLADIGTKPLPDGQFAYLRDAMCGYSLVKKNHPDYILPSYVV